MTEHTSLRVAVYIRIGGAGQCGNLEVQQKHYDAVIRKRPSWELAGIYADIGADSRKQPNLARLMADCRAGRIDLVLTKSTSRISRSIYKLMQVIRELAYLTPPVGVYFEDTEVNTLEKDKFLLLSMFEAISIQGTKEGKDQALYASLTKHMKKQKRGQHGDG